jgi:hypothetical protein
MHGGKVTRLFLSTLLLSCLAFGQERTDSVTVKSCAEQVRCDDVQPNGMIGWNGRAPLWRDIIPACWKPEQPEYVTIIGVGMTCEEKALERSLLRSHSPQVEAGAERSSGSIENGVRAVPQINATPRADNSEAAEAARLDNTPTQSKDTWRVLTPQPHHSWIERHRRPILIISALGGIGGGLLKASFERRGCNYAKYDPGGSGSQVNCHVYQEKR